MPDNVDFATAILVRRHFGSANTLTHEAEIQLGETVLVMGGVLAASLGII
jgi:NADPH:quinone reductase-like Zn-dependent oxidoreductase